MKSILGFLLILFCTKMSAQQTIQTSNSGFIENKGQVVDQHNRPNHSVKFLCSFPELQVQIRDNGYSYELKKELSRNTSFKGTGLTKQEIIDNIVYGIHRVDINFVGANSNIKWEASEPESGHSNYYTTGTPDAGILNVFTYHHLLAKEVWDKIDIEFLIAEGNDQPVKYNIIVRPGGNPTDIRFGVSGADQAGITPLGGLMIKTHYDDLEETIPMSYIEKSEGNTRREIEVRFRQLENNIFGFEVPGDFPCSDGVLVIDPTPDRIWGTYYGGVENDHLYSCKTDASNNIYSTGRTFSATNIATSGTYQSVYALNGDAFLCKFNDAGVRQWSSYFGGSATEEGKSCAIDNINNSIYISGYTTSSANIASTGAHQTNIGATGQDAFLAKFNASGARLWSTYYGGNSDEKGQGCTVDANGNVFLAGYTASTNNIATSGSHLSALQGQNDAFLAKFNSNGVRQWGTYYGGGLNDEGYACASDANGNIVVTGLATSSTGISTSGAHQVNSGSYFDSFIVKFNGNGVRQWGSYYGGTGDEWTESCNIDALGNILVFGRTNSPNNIATPGAHQMSFLGYFFDAFIAKFNSSGVRTWGTYYGGSGGNTLGLCGTTDTNNNVYLTGYTDANNIATSGSFQTSISGGGDCYLVKLNSNGVRQWSSYFGGTAIDQAFSCSAGVNGNVYICGETYSNNNISSSGSHQTNLGGNYDGFLAKFNDGTIVPPLTNDNCINAIPISCGQTLLGTTLNSANDIALGQAPNCNANSSSAGGVWYSLVGNGGTATISLCANATYDTKLAVYSGSCSALNCIVYNDDYCSTRSQVVFPTMAGINYLILIYGYNGATGNFTLTVTCTTNDNCINAFSVPVDGSAHSGYTNTGSTSESGEVAPPASGCNVQSGWCNSTLENSVWFKFVATGCSVDISTLGSSFDTQLALWTGCPSSGTLIAANDDYWGFSNSYTSLINDAQVTPGNTYFIQIDGYNGATGNISLTITNSGSAISATISNTSPTCSNLSNGMATVTASGASSYTYLWSNNQTTPTATNLSPGTYTVTVTSNNGCITTASATIATSSTPNAAITGIVSPCTGLSNGSATVTASGGVSPYTYLWSNGQTGATATNLTASTYSVTVTGNNGCTRSTSTTISSVTSPVATITIAVPPCAGLSNGSATVSVSGGVSPFTYFWSNGQTGAIANNLSAGTYTVTVTGSNGCTATATSLISSVTSPTATISSSVLPCAGLSNGSTTVNVSGGASPFTYLWSNGQTGSTANNLGAGTYTVTVTGSNSCSVTMSTTLNNGASPTATISNYISPCAGFSNGSATVSVTGGVSPYYYLWNNGQTGPSAINLLPGSYSVTITGANGCTTTSSANITMGIAPTATISNLQSSCTGLSNGSISVSASGGISPYTYMWSNGQTSSTINNLSAGSYSVTVTGNNGCTTNTSGIIISDPSPSVIITNVLSPCNGFTNGSATVSAGGGVPPYTYAWTNGQTGATASNLAPGNYTMTVTGNNGCTATATAVVTNASTPSANISNTVLPCFGTSMGSATVNVTGGESPLNYQWSNGQSGTTINNLSAGNYEVTVTGNNGCTATAFTSIVNAATPEAIISNVISPCAGFSNGSLTVIATGGEVPYNYSWNNGQTSSTANNLPPGTYTVTVTGNNGCNTAIFSTLNTLPTIEFNISSTPSCTGLATGTATALVTTGSPPYLYSWSNGQSNQTVAELNSGVYNITITDNNGCLATASVYIDDTPSPILSMTSEPTCIGQASGNATVTVTTGVSPYSYHWSNNQSTAVISDLYNGSYIVTVVSSNGCSATSSVTISQIPVFMIDLQTGLEQGGIACQSTAIVTSGFPPFSYLWSNGDTGQTAHNLPEGNFSITVTDDNGCYSVETGSCMTVNTKPITSLEFFKVTPNPANTNLKVEVRLNSSDILIIKLFNSLGQKLFEKINGRNEFEFNINVESFPTGYYFLQVATQSGTRTESILIEH